MWFIIYFEIKHKKHATEYILTGGAYIMVNFFPLQHLTDRQSWWKKMHSDFVFHGQLCGSNCAIYI